MPKELVEGTQCGCFDQSDPDECIETPVVDVRWDRESGYFQIATRAREAEVPTLEEHPIPAKYGYYVDLDRRGINQLIRNLRRARDQAFGRDE